MAEIIGNEALQVGLLKGAKTLADVVIPNYGPIGRNAIVDQKYDLPMVVNTGRKILKDFELPDRTENLGAVMLRDAAMKVGTENGDGAITTVVLTNAILRAGERVIASGANPMLLRKGIERGAKAAKEALQAQKLPCEGEALLEFAASAAKDEAVGKMACDAIAAVGEDGIITVADSQGRESLLHIWDGVRYDYGLLSNVMMTDKVERNVTFSDPYILLINYKVKSMDEIMKVLKQAIQYQAPLVMIVSDIDESVLRQLNANVEGNIVRLAVANAPGHGDTRRRNMLALAAKTGALFLEEGTGRDLKDCGLEICGRVKEAVIDKESTLLKGFPMESREMIDILMAHTKKQLSETTDPDETEKLETTVSILSGKLAEIIAGGVTEYEMFERKYHAENAVHAVKAAMHGGVLPGGGSAFLKAAEVVKAAEAGCTDAELQGVKIVGEALLAPMRTLVDNIGENGAFAVDRAQHAKGLLCCNVLTGKLEEPVAARILDGFDSDLNALATAADVAATLLTAAAAVIQS